MKIPSSLLSLVDDGVIDAVVSQLMSGKEAAVYVVRCGEQLRCAKVYKEAAKRSFKQAAQYREGRNVRNSRRARAMAKGSNFGRSEQEKIWQSAEIDALYALQNAGVRVPEPDGCFDGVLLMELICEDDGTVASRLNDVTMSAEQAIEDHQVMLQYIQRMLCIGIVHGDLSEFNVLVDDYGPVIIDLPQAVNAAANNNAKWMFERDVNNMRAYYGQFAPDLLSSQYAKEMWALYVAGELTPETVLTGLYKEPEQAANVAAVLDEIFAAQLEAETRQLRFEQDI
ncbi:PA4780 family RIO1-like protein kinase [Motilimonas eburnea]|uniref:PA4780 family RIO1-like protein kinase n=1 Tax=Motilimonas eburnea TaxID=1737488 RepID=UPI001E529D9F|nr:PA4780 family RIO1-like protein kinase [Motilimonas eburnea]MCE2573207.1 serine protein kinase RIO [Motilimonas eburnea]